MWLRRGSRGPAEPEQTGQTWGGALQKHTEGENGTGLPSVLEKGRRAGGADINLGDGERVEGRWLSGWDCTIVGAAQTKDH